MEQEMEANWILIHLLRLHHPHPHLHVLILILLHLHLHLHVLILLPHRLHLVLIYSFNACLGWPRTGGAALSQGLVWLQDLGGPLSHRFHHRTPNHLEEEADLWMTTAPPPSEHVDETAVWWRVSWEGSWRLMWLFRPSLPSSLPTRRVGGRMIYIYIQQTVEVHNFSSSLPSIMKRFALWYDASYPFFGLTWGTI